MMFSETSRWALNLLAAIITLLLLGLHMGLMHLDGLLALINPRWADPLGWDQLIGRGQGLFFAINYIVLLAVALYHGFYGLHTMLTEIWPGRRAGLLLTRACVTLGIGLFVLGTVAVVGFGILYNAG